MFENILLLMMFCWYCEQNVLANFCYRVQRWTYLATPTTMARLNTVRLTYIYNSYCLHERKHHLRDGLVGDAVVVSFSAKEQVKDSYFH